MNRRQIRLNWENMFGGLYPQKQTRTIVKSINSSIQIKCKSCNFISLNIEQFIKRIKRIYRENNNLLDTLNITIHASIRDRYMGKYERGLNGHEIPMFYDFDKTKKLCSDIFNDEQVYAIALICETLTIDLIQAVINRLHEEGKSRINSVVVEDIIEETPALSHAFL